MNIHSVFKTLKNQKLTPHFTPNECVTPKDQKILTQLQKWSKEGDFIIVVYLVTCPGDGAGTFEIRKKKFEIKKDKYC